MAIPKDPNCPKHGDNRKSRGAKKTYSGAAGKCTCWEHLRETIRKDVLWVSFIAQDLWGQVQQKTITDAAAVKRVLNHAAHLSLASGYPDEMVYLVANVLVNLSNFSQDGFTNSIRRTVAVEPQGHYFVNFANSGFCRLLRDLPESDEGNLPHHMLAYFVMNYCLQRKGWGEWGSSFISVGVVAHEMDTLLKTKSNPNMAGDLQSGALGVELAVFLAESPKSRLAQFEEYFAKRALMTKCGHAECKK